MGKSMGTRGQMSEAVSTDIFLASSGDFQDAYTYYYRGNVFTNAQVDNIVFMRSHLATREWDVALRYLASTLALTDGVYMVEHVRRPYRQDKRLHWRQPITTIEIIFLFVVGFLPQDMNMTTNIIVSFVCTLQINVFREIKESPYATIMCIGNLRGATENLYWYCHAGQKDHRDKCIRCYRVTDISAVGAIMGSVLTVHLGGCTIQAGCGLPLASSLIMFVKGDVEGGHV